MLPRHSGGTEDALPFPNGFHLRVDSTMLLSLSRGVMPQEGSSQNLPAIGCSISPYSSKESNGHAPSVSRDIGKKADHKSILEKQKCCDAVAECDLVFSKALDF